MLNPNIFSRVFGKILCIFKTNKRLHFFLANSIVQKPFMGFSELPNKLDPIGSDVSAFIGLKRTDSKVYVKFKF